MKGLYAKASRGELQGLTGVDDPYEAPLAPEITLTTVDCSPEENAYKILSYMQEKGYLDHAAAYGNGPEDFNQSSGTVE